MKVSINGFGRIGRITLRALLVRTGIDVVAINDLTHTSTLAHLFKYDSVHRAFSGSVTSDENSLTIDGKIIRVFCEKDPLNLPWRELGVDLVIESTGKFITAEHAG